jgi:two-component system sensor kinase FixL
MPSPPGFLPDDEPGGLLRAIVESSDDAIIGKALDGTIVSWNAAAERMYGYNAGDAIGQSISLIIPEEHQGEFRQILDQIQAGRRVPSYETVRRTRAGRLLTVSLTVSPILDARGRILGASAIARDITESRRIRAAFDASEERYRSVVDSAVDAIIVIDHLGCIESFNVAATRLFGFSAAEVVGQNVKMLMPEPYRSEHDQYLERHLSTGERHIIGVGREVTGRRKDGSTFPLQLSVGEMTIGGEKKFTGILHDLTARVRLETQLREQEALKRLGEMAAVVAHEVKNPLTGIRGAVQIIGGRLPAGSRDAEVIKEIIARIDALNELMRDLLLFARPPRPNIVSTEPRPIVMSAIGLAQQDPGGRGVAFEVTGDCPPVAGDAELLKMVLQNLLLNAVHAVQGKGRIRIELESSRDRCTIAVADSGPGIPLEIREKLFTPFFTTKSRGTGLGLSTAKRFVEAQGGSLALEWPDSGGTRVRLELPLADRPGQA